MDPAQQSPVLPACCFAPAAWKGVLSSKRANQVVPAEMVALENNFGTSLPSQSAGKALQSVVNNGLERAETSTTWGGVLPEQIVSGNVFAEKDGPRRLTIEIGERGDGLSPSRILSGVSSSSSSTECEPIPAGTPLWNALLHQSPSRDSIRTPHTEKTDCTAGYEDKADLAKQLSTIGRASVVVGSVHSKLRISVPLEQHSAAVHICTASEGESGSSSAGVMSQGKAAGCLQCAATAGALDAMRKYWEQAEQRAREAEAAATRMGRNEERLVAQLVLLLKQVELRQVQVDHLSGLVAQQQAAFLALNAHSLERLRAEQGLSEEPATPPSQGKLSVEECALSEQLMEREVTKGVTFFGGQRQAENNTKKERGEGTGGEPREDLVISQTSHQHDVSEAGGGKVEVKRVVGRGVSLDAWAETRDISDGDGNGGPSCGDDESGADSSFEFDTSPLAVLSASSPEAESEVSSPGIRRQRRGRRKGAEVIVEEVVDAGADPELAQGGFGEFFVSQSVPESPLKRRVCKKDKWSCDSPLESERDLSAPGEGLGSGQGSESDESTEAGSPERTASGGSSVGGPEGVGEETAWGGLEAKASETESGSGEMEEFLGLPMEEQHVENGFGEEMQGSAPTNLTDFGSAKSLGQGTGRQVMVEGAGASFHLGYAELSRASVHDEKNLRSSWPVTAAGIPQTRRMNAEWDEGEGPESVRSDGRIPEQNGRAYTVDGRSGSMAWAMEPLEIAHEVVVEGFGDEDFDGWRHGEVTESGTASRTSPDTSSPEPPLMESFGGESKTDGFAELSSPQGRQGACGGSPKLVPYSPRGPRSNPPSPRLVPPKTVVPTPPLNPRGASPGSPHFGSSHEFSRKVVGIAATSRKVGSQSDLAAAGHRLETRAGKLFRSDSLPRRNNTSDPFGLQEAALVPHPPSVAAPARKPSTREKQLAASVSGRKSSDKENDLPKVPTVTLRLEGLAFNRKPGGDLENGKRVGPDLMRTSGLELGTEWGSSASDEHSNDIAAPEPPARPRTTSSRPQFRALRPMAS